MERFYFQHYMYIFSLFKAFTESYSNQSFSLFQSLAAFFCNSSTLSLHNIYLKNTQNIFYFDVLKSFGSCIYQGVEFSCTNRIKTSTLRLVVPTLWNDWKWCMDNILLRVSKQARNPGQRKFGWKRKFDEDMTLKAFAGIEITDNLYIDEHKNKSTSKTIRWL